MVEHRAALASAAPADVVVAPVVVAAAPVVATARVVVAVARVPVAVMLAGAVAAAACVAGASCFAERSHVVAGARRCAVHRVFVAVALISVVAECLVGPAVALAVMRVGPMVTSTLAGPIAAAATVVVNLDVWAATARLERGDLLCRLVCRHECCVRTE